jgi:transposase
MSHLSIEDRYAIVALAKYAGWKQEKIAETMKCSQGEVSQLLHKYKTHHTVEDLPKSGRPASIDISNKQDNPITNVIREN